jgi:hypothetical protein
LFLAIGLNCYQSYWRFLVCVLILHCLIITWFNFHMFCFLLFLSLKSLAYSLQFVLVCHKFTFIFRFRWFCILLLLLLLLCSQYFVWMCSSTMSNKDSDGGKSLKR